jgi:hypothetical protein
MSSPGDQDLRWGLVDFFGDSLDCWCVDDSWFTGNVVSEGRVGSDDDVLLLAWSSASSLSREVGDSQYLNNSG